jgi:GH15 family glucan-1,4-alpha-glucosidase
MSSLDLAVVGNCSFGALIDQRGRVVWSCLPRFDGDPVFCALLDDHGDASRGFWDIDLFDRVEARQSYRRNSAVLQTVLTDSAGNGIEITDYAPRFKQYDRTFRPMMLIRHVRPIAGTPRICIRLRPSQDFGAGTPPTTRGSNHIRYLLPDLTLRLTTDAPVSYVLEEKPFILETPINLVLGPDESLTDSLPAMTRAFYEKTDAYWKDWSRFLSIPFEWQDAVIRAAVTLKLCSFEETGAIIAAMTTSIPEAPGTERNWDYRLCWLRDSFYVVHALNRLGATRTMEGFLAYINDLVAGWDGGNLQPVFGVVQETQLHERKVVSLSGYRGMGPVRVGNDAFTQIQNDGYGSVILSSAQTFFDRRLSRLGDASLFHRLERLGARADALWDQPDAGLWELRTRKSVHTYSSMLCWAGCDRLSRIAGHLGIPERQSHWRERADIIRAEVLERAWNPKVESFVQSFGGSEADASLLLMPYLGFLDAGDPRFAGTLAHVERELRRGNYMFRYANRDDFGVPDTAFNVCTFWYIDALVAVGRQEEARELFEEMLRRRNPLGLLSEDIDPDSGELWGNFPQTYSMVGIINSAMRLSKPWEEAF